MQKVATQFRPERVILFGSYARGKPTADSDVDLLVVMPFKGSGLDQAAEIIRKTRPRFAVDLIVRTPEDLDRRLAMNDFFLREATREGQLLYETADR